ncbi:MAG: glycerol-3-phosphate acyltransferase, partial [Tabrizicola sp.]|nr:glycerol-3-phosphate acyltransferase [Tabrizicola sp.]
LPVPLVAAVLATGPQSRDELVERAETLVARLKERGAVLKLPPQGAEDLIREGLEPLIARGIVDAGLRPVPGQEALLAFYAASVPVI